MFNLQKRLTKRIYNSGSGSPGATAEQIAKSIVQYQLQGMSRKYACKAVFLDYLGHFAKMGFNIPGDLAKDILETADDKPSLISFALVILANSKNSATLKQIEKDLSVIINVIMERQNKIIGHKTELSPIIQFKFELILSLIQNS